VLDGADPLKTINLGLPRQALKAHLFEAPAERGTTLAADRPPHHLMETTKLNGDKGFVATINEIRVALKALGLPDPEQGEDDDTTYLFRLLMLLDTYAVCTRMEVSPHCTSDMIAQLKRDTQWYTNFLSALPDPHVFAAAQRAHDAEMLLSPYAESAPDSAAAVVAVLLSAASTLFKATMLNDAAVEEEMPLEPDREPVVIPTRARLLLQAREKLGAVHAWLNEVTVGHVQDFQELDAMQQQNRGV